MYNYADEKSKILTDEGQRNFIKVRDKVKAMLEQAGCFRMEKAMITGGSDWTKMAYVDRMVELGEIREIRQDLPAGQHRIFVAA